jgi:uncharacterized protein (DUF433 family)
MTTQTRREQELIARWIGRNPRKPGDDEVLIRDTGVPVWALIAYLPAVGNDPDRAARSYELEPEAVRAATAYYTSHREAIDARLAQNASYAGRRS